MANRRVFISFLGTGNYVQTYYSFNGKTTNPVRFVQEALVENICKDWNDNDRIFIFCTEQAKNLNGVDNGHGKSFEVIENYGLESRLNKLRLSVPFEKIDINDGLSEEEIWSIFEVVYGQLQEGDELYFDVTHAFRSIPLFSTILFNYAALLKKTTLKAVHYGAFEKLGAAYKLREKPLQERGVASILDLTPIVRLQEWTMAANSFLKYGKMQHLGNVIAITSEKQRANLAGNRIKLFEDQVATCRGNELQSAKVANEVKKLLNDLMKSSTPEAVKNIAHELVHKLDSFGVNDEQNLKASIDWCLEFGLIQQAYTLAQESITTIICKRLIELKQILILNAKNEKDSIKEFREYISSILSVNDKAIANPQEMKGLLKANLAITKQMFNLKWVKDLRSSYKSITQNRNSINHGGFTDPRTSKELINQSSQYINECWDILTTYQITMPKIEEEKTKRLFVNFSNHPSQRWCDTQREAASGFGEIVDIPFPKIDPNATSAEVEALARKCADDIIAIAGTAEVTAHVMGEMVFTHKLVNFLQAEGIHCVASTTEHIVEYNSDGSKTSVFRFLQFRDY